MDNWYEPIKGEIVEIGGKKYETVLTSNKSRELPCSLCDAREFCVNTVLPNCGAFERKDKKQYFFKEVKDDSSNILQKDSRKRNHSRKSTRK